MFLLSEERNRLLQGMVHLTVSAECPCYSVNHNGYAGRTVTEMQTSKFLGERNLTHSFRNLSMSCSALIFSLVTTKVLLDLTGNLVRL